MADDDERAVEALEPFLEPFDRAEVEMVGRLVEQQHVGLLRQRPRDRRAPPLAAAGGRGRPVEVDPELVGDRRGLVRLRRVGRRASTQSSSVAKPSIVGSCSSSTTCVPGTIVRLPSSVSIRSARHLSSVVLPAPLRPISASRSRVADVEVEAAEQPAFALDEPKVFVGEDRRRHGGAPSASCSAQGQCTLQHA